MSHNVVHENLVGNEVRIRRNGSSAPFEDVMLFKIELVRCSSRTRFLFFSHSFTILCHSLRIFRSCRYSYPCRVVLSSSLSTSAYFPTCHVKPWRLTYLHHLLYTIIWSKSSGRLLRKNWGMGRLFLAAAVVRRARCQFTRYISTPPLGKKWTLMMEMNRLCQ